MSENIIIHSANTLNVNAVPGEDKRFPSLSTEAIFSFGDYRIERSLSSNFLSGQTSQTSFSNFGTLNSLSKESTFDSSSIINITTNDLNPKKDEANSYAYFGSFYTKVSKAINNIIDNFPYGILSYASGTGSTILNYSNTLTGSCQFIIPASALTNQGNIIYASGYTATATTINLYNNYIDFEIELSSTTQYTQSYPIQSYSYSANTGMLGFVVTGNIFTASTSSSTLGVYILPSSKRYYQYKRTLSNLEYQLLIEQKFMVPNPDDDLFENQEFLWPKTIDGFNPDSYGSTFDDYSEELLRSCTLIDDIKTDWMIRTIIPENYLLLDSDNNNYRKIITVYAEELDKIKQYIDGIAFAHSVNYSNEEAIPNKFLHRLSKLLGWEPINEFNDVDIFEYLAQEDSDGQTVSDYNHELWRKILININWLYKKKGTREALEFIFKLMGAPACLINFNELVYKINQSVSGVTGSNFSSYKVDESTGYPNYDLGSNFVFQENGPGRGDGDEYIKQWEPEYNPIREVDNIKVYTGSSEFFGTSNIMNTKQVNIELSPAAAIECDLNTWYNLGFVSGGTGVGVPTYVDVAGIPVYIPSSISGMSLNNWLTYVYTNANDPKKRKTIGYNANQHTTFYSSLRDVYLAYYFWNNTSTASNRLNFRKLEAFLALIERNFGAYIERLIPATTIIEGEGVLYRNTMFNRQKFVYPPGINDGSEFQIAAPLSPDLTINGFAVSSTIQDILNPHISSVAIGASVNDNYNPTISTVNVVGDIDIGINPSINGVVVYAEIASASIQLSQPLPAIIGDIAAYPESGTLEAQPSLIPTPYRTKTSVIIRALTSSSTTATA